MATPAGRRVSAEQPAESCATRVRPAPQRAVDETFIFFSFVERQKRTRLFWRTQRRMVADEASAKRSSSPRGSRIGCVPVASPPPRPTARSRLPQDVEPAEETNRPESCQSSDRDYESVPSQPESIGGLSAEDTDGKMPAHSLAPGEGVLSTSGAEQSSAWIQKLVQQKEEKTRGAVERIQQRADNIGKARRDLNGRIEKLRGLVSASTSDLPRHISLSVSAQTVGTADAERLLERRLVQAHVGDGSAFVPRPVEQSAFDMPPQVSDAPGPALTFTPQSQTGLTYDYAPNPWQPESHPPSGLVPLSSQPHTRLESRPAVTSHNPNSASLSNEQEPHESSGLHQDNTFRTLPRLRYNSVTSAFETVKGSPHPHSPLPGSPRDMSIRNTSVAGVSLESALVEDQGTRVRKQPENEEIQGRDEAIFHASIIESNEAANWPSGLRAEVLGAATLSANVLRTKQDQKQLKTIAGDILEEIIMYGTPPQVVDPTTRQPVGLKIVHDVKDVCAGRVVSSPGLPAHSPDRSDAESCVDDWSDLFEETNASATCAPMRQPDSILPEHDNSGAENDGMEVFGATRPICQQGTASNFIVSTPAMQECVSNRTHTKFEAADRTDQTEQLRASYALAPRSVETHVRESFRERDLASQVSPPPLCPYAGEASVDFAKRVSESANQKGHHQIVGLHVALATGLRVKPVDEALAYANRGPGVVTKVNRDLDACFVKWDLTEEECGWYRCGAYGDYTIRLLSSAEETPMQVMDMLTSGGNSKRDIANRLDDYHEKHGLEADNIFVAVFDMFGL